MNYPPYLPSAAWYRRWLEAISEGYDDDHAIIIANRKEGVSRELARTVVRDTSHRDLMLSIAVEGGSRQLRTGNNIGEIYLSEHGNWRHTHLNAIGACYGKKPFYPFIFDSLNEIYDNRETVRLEDFNLRLHLLIKDWLIGSIVVTDINLFNSNPVLIERGKEIGGKIIPEISVLDAIMNFGKEAILGIFTL